jgi:hypothetical protein
LAYVATDEHQHAVRQLDELERRLNGCINAGNAVREAAISGIIRLFHGVRAEGRLVGFEFLFRPRGHGRLFPDKGIVVPRHAARRT